MRYVLPGMGATRAMFTGPWLTLSDTVFVDWPRMSSPITLSGLADRHIQEHDIKADDQLVGTSMGGMVALEIAAAVGCSDVTLIASATSRDEINGLLRALAPISEMTPLRLVQRVAGKSGGEMGAMFADADPAFIREACRALCDWEGVADDAIRVRRVHGSRDHVIACPKQADLILPGGHLIAMTHANDCVAFLRDAV